MEWSRGTAGPGGRTLEDLFHLMVVVLIETTNLLGFFGTLHLSANISVLRTVVRLNAQATIGPQLPLASSTRAKWRALRSARVSTLKKCLTAPTLSEMRQTAPEFGHACPLLAHVYTR